MLLKTIRQAKKLTMREVAERAGVTESFYCLIENGARKPSVRTAKAIAAVLGFDWTEFFNEAPTAM